MPSDDIQLEQIASLELEKQSLIQAAEFVGATRLINKLSGDLALQTMQALEVFQSNKMFEQYGYKTFADFLDKCPSSPMTKNQYYDRKKLLEQEGEDAFNLLNSLNIPAKHRKLLTAGDVVLDGDQLIVGDKSVAINDAKGVRKAIAQAVQRFEQIEAKSAKSEKEIEKLKKQIEEFKTEAQNAPTIDAEASLVTQGIIKIATGFADLVAGLRELNAADFTTYKKKQARRVDSIIEGYATFLNDHKPKAGKSAEPAADEDDELSDDELAGFLNDD